MKLRRGLFLGIFSTVFAFACLNSQPSFGYAFSVCKKDFDANCKDMEFNEENLTECFTSKKTKLSGQCKKYFDTLNATKNPLNKMGGKDKAEKGDDTKAKTTKKLKKAKKKTTKQKKKLNDQLDKGMEDLGLDE